MGNRAVITTKARKVGSVPNVGVIAYPDEWYLQIEGELMAGSKRPQRATPQPQRTEPHYRIPAKYPFSAG